MPTIDPRPPWFVSSREVNDIVHFYTVFLHAPGTPTKNRGYIPPARFDVFAGWGGGYGADQSGRGVVFWGYGMVLSIVIESITALGGALCAFDDHLSHETQRFYRLILGLSVFSCNDLCKRINEKRKSKNNLGQMSGLFGSVVALAYGQGCEYSVGFFS